MRDSISTTFGLLIAYLLPGLISLFSLALFFPDVADVFETFLTVESNVGLFLLVVSAAIAAGLAVNALRWLLFERVRRNRLKPRDFALLGSPGKLDAYRAAIDENFRHHQFLGGTSIAVVPLVAGFAVRFWNRIPFWGDIALLISLVGFETLMVVNANEAYDKFFSRARNILGGTDDERAQQG